MPKFLALSALPMKFECTHCNQVYLHAYQQDDHHYPTCPECHKAGLLLGMTETEDFLRHPIVLISSYFRWAKIKWANPL